MTIKLTAGQIVRIGTALALSVFVLMPNAARLSAQAPGQAGPSGPAGPGGRGQGGGGGASASLEGKTAAEAYKNIKVLKDIPADELVPTMVFISASLGVRCEHCHVPGHFDQDYKKEKDIARDMMKMMFAINTENFKGERVVTCDTCHNGTTPPSGIPLLPGQAPAGMQMSATPTAPQGGGGGRGPAAEASSSPFAGPSPADILSKYVLALGGDAAIQKAKSRSQTGAVDAAIQPGPPGAPLAASPVIEAYWTASGKAFQVVHGQRGDNSQGYDGKTGWATGGQGNVTAQPAGAMVAFREWAELFPALHFTTQYSKIEVTGIEKIGGHDAYRVIGKRDGGSDRLYFDTDSGLLLRTWTTFDTALGEIPQQTDYSDYRDVNGVKFPYVVHVVSSEGGDRTYRWNQIQVNGAVDDSLSNRPAAKPAGSPAGGQPGAMPSGSQPRP